MSLSAEWKVLFALTLAVGLVPQAKAVTGCSNDLLTGVYGLQISGALTAPISSGFGGAPLLDGTAARLTAAAAPVSKGAAGFARLVIDGAGGLYGNAAASIAGDWSEGQVTGAYTVNPDCTFTVTLTDSAGALQHFDGVLTRAGDSGVLLQVDPGVGISATLKRAAAVCDGSTVPQSLRLQASGTLSDSTAFSSIGVIEVDDQGNAVASESRYAGGSPSRVTSSGSMTVNSDCTFALSLAPDAGGPTVNYRGILVNNSRELMLVRSDTGASVAGDVVGQ